LQYLRKRVEIKPYLSYTSYTEMKDQTFELKIGDLLNQVAVDEITFKNKKTDLIPNLSED
jgi:hypothetical protein